MTLDAQRWERLERYARWKRHSFRIEKLPNDILAYIAVEYLSNTDICNLLTAMIPASRFLRSRVIDLNLRPASMNLSRDTRTRVWGSVERTRERDVYPRGIHGGHLPLVRGK